MKHFFLHFYQTGQKQQLSSTANYFSGQKYDLNIFYYKSYRVLQDMNDINTNTCRLAFLIATISRDSGVFVATLVMDSSLFIVKMYTDILYLVMEVSTCGSEPNKKVT